MNPKHPSKTTQGKHQSQATDVLRGALLLDYTITINNTVQHLKNIQDKTPNANKNDQKTRQARADGAKTRDALSSSRKAIDRATPPRRNPSTAPSQHHRPRDTSKYTCSYYIVHTLEYNTTAEEMDQTLGNPIIMACHVASSTHLGLTVITFRRVLALRH